MATLVFSALGTALGGPLGGALGGLLGNQLDRAIVGSPKREGSRLKELSVTTSSYGTAIPRHFGQMRAAGTVIWATDLKESEEKSGSSKASPSVTTYAYSASFAVALSSRPVERVGRIWADGNLLRGAAGDLKVGGRYRFYSGHGDQQRDPLIASDRGADCPAFRNIAYCVFEDLQLEDFGNRIPSLTFEVIADSGSILLGQMLEQLGRRASSTQALDGLAGFSDEGGELASSLAVIDQLYPMICDGSGEVLTIKAADESMAATVQLPEAAVDTDDDTISSLSGKLARRLNDAGDIPDGLRYYDVERDYQAGMQRAEGQARPGRSRVMEFPGALRAAKARQLCNSFVQRAAWSGDQLLWRIAEVDAALAPGQVVSVPGFVGTWRIENWEWRTSGVELELRRLPPGPAKLSPADPGTILAPRDSLATPTVLMAFELPWSGNGSGDERQIYAAASSSSNGWTGAALYAVDASALRYLQPSGSRRSIVGNLALPLTASPAVLLDRQESMIVTLISNDFVLTSATIDDLGEGRNRALVGDEVVQFASAEPLGAQSWRLHGLLRGRGGTEAAALRGQSAGAAFVLLDQRPVLLDTTETTLSAAQDIAAIGLADDTPVIAQISNHGASRRPLTPVHPRVDFLPDGAWELSWCRRARGAWSWPESGEVPLIEQEEQYLVGVGDSDAPATSWQISEPRLLISVDTMSLLRSGQLDQPVWVRQIGTWGLSDPLLLCRLA